MRKPANLVYGVDERPPSGVLFISAIQHVGVIAIFMIYPLIIAREAAIPSEQVTNLLRMGMLALAIAVVLQALPIGSRFLAPSIFTGVYLAPSLLAVKAGGMALVWGMTIFAGLVEVALSQVWTRLRTFIPPETAGLVVFLVGVIIGLAAVRVLLGNNTSGSLNGSDAGVTAIALGVMIGLNIWNKGRLRLFCILIGMIVGYVAAALAGSLATSDLALVLNQPLVALPTTTFLSWSFDASMIIPFAVSGLAAAMSTTAVVTTYQRATDDDWVRPDMKSISRGVLGDGLAVTAAGVLGTYGLTVSTANVGLIAATGVASRAIAYAIAALLCIAAIQPHVIGVLAIMPTPVMASAMLFTCVFIMISGVQIISSRVLDPRRTLVIGMGMMAFFFVSVFPNAFARAPEWAQPLVSSPLVLATLVGLGLNLIFRIGIRRTVTMSIDPSAPDLDAVHSFIERNAGIWGARRDVVNRVKFALPQAAEAIVEHYQPKGPVTLAISYDEFDIDASLSYAGTPLELADAPPAPAEVAASEEGARRLAGFLIKWEASKVQVTKDDGNVVVRLHFRQ